MLSVFKLVSCKPGASGELALNPGQDQFQNVGYMLILCRGYYHPKKFLGNFDPQTPHLKEFHQDDKIRTRLETLGNDAN